MVFIFLFFAIFSLDQILPILFGLLTCMGLTRIYVFNTLLTSRRKRTPDHYLRHTHNLWAFHRKHVLLSHVMLLSWFVSTYLRHCTVMSFAHFSIPPGIRPHDCVISWESVYFHSIPMRTCTHHFKLAFHLYMIYVRMLHIHPNVREFSAWIRIVLIFALIQVLWLRAL